MMLRSVARLLRQFRSHEPVVFVCGGFRKSQRFRQGSLRPYINLGDVSGIELRHRLAANGNSVPIIYMTGNDSPAVRAAAHQSGCLAYLTKPFSAKSLLEPLKRASAA